MDRASLPFSADVDRPRPSATDARARQVELILEQIDQLPTLAPIATRLLSVTAADDADINEISALIESDPALTTRILSLCRRADRPLVERVETVKRAVVLLGLEAVQSAVLSVAVYDVLSEAGSELDESMHARHQTSHRPGSSNTDSTDADSSEPPAFDRNGLWRHLIGVACAAERIAAANKSLGVRADAAFVAGLLHDIGRLALELALPRATLRVLALAERRQLDSAAVEAEILGVDHHTAGRRLAERWGLPESIQRVIWLHSQPLAGLSDVEHRNTIGVVALAKSLCREVHLGWSGDFARPAPSTELARAIGAAPASIERIAAQIHEATAERCNDLGLDDADAPQMLLSSIALANRRLSHLNQAMDDRARQAHQMSRIIEEVCAFHHDQGASGLGLTAAYAEIVRSARRLLGEGFFSIIEQARPSDDWTVQQFAPDGRVLRRETLQPPAGAEAGGRSLADFADPSQISVGAIGLLPWLSDYLGDAQDLRGVRIVPLTNAGPATALLHDRDPREAGLDTRSLRAALATWSSSILAAARHDQVLGLGEQLAASNRSLAEAQASLTEAESLARLGEMTAGAAHEMNNPLTVIRGRSQILTTRLSDPANRASAAAIADAAADLSELITSLHVLSDTPTPSRERIDVRETLERAASIARERAMTGPGVRIEVEEVAREAFLDRDRITQAVSELIANALQAARDRVVLIRAETESADGRLVIVVEDDGEGLTEKAKRHAFDPFFSEKPAGRQRGLGLSRAKKLVDLHGGELTLDHVPTGGARATIRLPAWRAGTNPEGLPPGRRDSEIAA
ncbi:MAG: HDOD domain-containing protein [Planctomycetota bacterium]